MAKILDLVFRLAELPYGPVVLGRLSAMDIPASFLHHCHKVTGV
jgi:hypothetical protein